MSYDQLINPPLLFPFTIIRHILQKIHDIMDQAEHTQRHIQNEMHQSESYLLLSRWKQQELAIIVQCDIYTIVKCQ